MSNINMLSSGSSKSAKVAREQASADEGFVYKAATQLYGVVLFTYTVAILGLLGALKGQSFKTSALTGMFGSDTVLTHHRKMGNIVMVKRGIGQLSPAGIRLFEGRAKDTIKGQKIEPADVQAVAVAIKTKPTVKAVVDNPIVRQISWRKTGETK